MALEKRLKAIPAQLFTADGSADGLVTLVGDACRFKVKQQVFLSATSLQNLQLEVKRVVSDTQLYVGPCTGNIDIRTDISAYTVVLGASITANEQKRPSIPFEEVVRATYEEEPTVAQRSFLVDRCGDDYNKDNPFPVAATFDGDVKVGDIRITACDDDPKVGDKHSSVRIAGPDCDNEMVVNPDGSINVMSAAESVTTPLIQNFSAALANTEYSVILPISTKRFIIKSRSGDPKIQLAYTAGDTNTIYVTIRPGNSYSESAINLPAPTPLYFRSNKPSEIIEIVSWT